MLDRYVLKQFVQTFLFGLLAFISIYLIVDLIENLDDFSDRDVPWPVVAEYYLYYIPEILKLITPIAILLASLFTMGRLDTTHELTAMRSAGRSMKRIAVPMLLFALLLSVTLIWFNGWVVPDVNKQRYAIERQHLGRNLIGNRNDVHLRLSPTLNLRMEFFDPRTGEANNVSLERIEPDARLIVPSLAADGQGSVIAGADTVRSLAVVERIDAKTMTYDTVSGAWTMKDGVARNLRDPEQIGITAFERRVMENLPVTPELLNLSQQRSDELTISELRQRISQERLSGRDIRGLEVEYHSQFAFPFAALIVVFFGIPFASSQRKGGAAMPIAITAGLSALYLVFTEVSKTLTVGADVSPVVTAWIANGLFFLIGTINLIRVERT